MIYFKTIPLNYEGTLNNNNFSIPESPSTEAVLNTHVKAWKGKRYGSVDAELELYNFVAEKWPFVNLEGRGPSQRPQLPLVFSLS